ncbi:hypothetical protein OOT55_11990 [Marinimicrobium sp. C6131]|nr:hypothetical protein [Marinimicrobium sp. C6131]UZJ43372.1 hypothetical protein OOT55_11990 [Marinimicrobium sp. C6131]
MLSELLLSLVALETDELDSSDVLLSELEIELSLLELELLV